ncbi:unnamed protein product [Camellia sinensis]
MALISLLLREDLFVSFPYYREKACSELCNRDKFLFFYHLLIINPRN